MLKNICLVVFIACCSMQSLAQSATGAFYGRADVLNTGSNSNNYLTELIIKQKGNEVEGIFGYYFKDSYQSFFVRGTYDKKTRLVHIKNLPVIFYGSSTRNGIECPMNFMGTLMVSKAGSSINGSFYASDKYKYTCPEIRVAYKIDDSEDPDGRLRQSTAGQQFWKPMEEDFVVTSLEKKQTKTLEADVNTSSRITDSTGKLKLKEKELIRKFEERKSSFSKEILVESDSLRISFYDNGEIDGDSISVFMNGAPVVVSKELSSRALNIYVALDSNREVNELSMFAENLGTLPPNTALMLVTDGINRYEIYLSSSLTSNAVVRIRKKK